MGIMMGVIDVWGYDGSHKMYGAMMGVIECMGL